MSMAPLLGRKMSKAMLPLCCTADCGATAGAAAGAGADAGVDDADADAASTDGDVTDDSGSSSTV